MAKSAVRQKRIEEIYKLLLCGCDRRKIIAYANIQRWEVSNAVIDEYIEDATAELIERTPKPREQLLEIARRKLDDQYYKSYAINDFKTCLQIQKELNEINGLHQIQVQQTVQIDDREELRKKIDAAIAANPGDRERIADAIRGRPLIESDESDDAE